MKTVIEMARDACDKDKVDAWHNGFWTLTQEELERFAELVAKAAIQDDLLWQAETETAVLAEREAAEERVTDLFADMETPYLPDIVAAIRARGNT